MSDSGCVCGGNCVYSVQKASHVFIFDLCCSACCIHACTREIEREVGGGWERKRERGMEFFMYLSLISFVVYICV